MPAKVHANEAQALRQRGQHGVEIAHVTQAAMQAEQRRAIWLACLFHIDLRVAHGQNAPAGVIESGADGGHGRAFQAVKEEDGKNGGRRAGSRRRAAGIVRLCS